MAVFDFPYHLVETEHPETSVKLKFGRGYAFATKPQGPGNKIFILSFKAMFFWLNGSGVIDATINPKSNMQALINFYETHECYTPFDYPHPIRGTQVCRFETPLKEPKIVEGSFGVVEPFQVRLIHLP